MKTPKIQTVCGFGCGSSLMLRMAVEDVARQNGYEVEAFCGDVATACSNDCDVIFISEELGDRIKDRAQVPVTTIENFLNRKEIEEKTLNYLASLKQGE